MYWILYCRYATVSGHSGH